MPMTFSLSLECQYNRDTPYNEVKDDDEDEDSLDNDEGARAGAPDSEVSESSRRSSLGNNGAFVQKAHQQTAKQKLRQLQELVAMVQVRQMRKCLKSQNRSSFVISKLGKLISQSSF